ncbi:MAG: hypothetical protein Q7S40_28685 [Opitutaceae bacterium]|nr:hypothetical protein [Opitutaceae bacterium]
MKIQFPSRYLHAVLFTATLAGVAAGVPAGEIRHRFLAVDESRTQLHYVDQGNPSRDWTLTLPCKHRDLQLVGRNRLLMSWPEGYREFDLGTRKIVKEVKGYQGASTARRLPDGRTVLSCNFQGVTVYELGADDQVLRKVSFKTGATRVLRRTSEDTLLFGSGPQLFEGDWSGRILRTFTLPGKSWVYQALRQPDGHLLVAGGYNPALFELDPQGQVVRALGNEATTEAQSSGWYFLGGFQILPSGDAVVCNWTGHGHDDSRKGPQILQFNRAGEVVWKWHDPQRAGSINGVLILDGLDAAVLHDDVGFVLGPVK